MDNFRLYSDVIACFPKTWNVILYRGNGTTSWSSSDGNREIKSEMDSEKKRLYELDAHIITSSNSLYNWRNIF